MGLPHPSRGIVRLDPCTAARAGAAILVCPIAFGTNRTVRVCAAIGDWRLFRLCFCVSLRAAHQRSSLIGHCPPQNNVPACPKQCFGTCRMQRHFFKIAVSCDLDARGGVGLSIAACMCTRQLQSPRSRNEARRLCRATPSGCGVVQCANVNLVERARHLQDYFRMRCREFGRRRRLPRSKIADAPAGIRSPTKKSLRKQSRAGVQVFNHLGIECWGFIILGPLFIISLLTAGVINAGVY